MPQPRHNRLKHSVRLNDADKFSSHFTPNTTVLTKLTAVVKSRETLTYTVWAHAVYYLKPSLTVRILRVSFKTTWVCGIRQVFKCRLQNLTKNLVFKFSNFF
jgi:hypothetical protein